MRILKNLTAVALLVLCMNFDLTAQDDALPPVPQYVVATTAHWDLNKKDFSMEKWKAGEKEFFDKVTSKNELILGTDVAIHAFTADNTEIVFVAAYASWGDIDAAGKRNQELAKAAWPDDNERATAARERASYYTDYHSDEIYATAPGAKRMEEAATEPLVLYVRKSQGAFPADGNAEEYDGLMKEFNDAVIQKNELIKAYYPNYHAWGSDRREFLEAFYLSSFTDIQASFDRNQELINANWPDEEARKAFFDKLSKYFTGAHGDFIYNNVPELVK